ncbi:hypothetical protein [Bacillus sp. AK128]
MLIDINLLPKKEVRNIASLVLFVVPLVVAILLITIFLFQQMGAKEEIESLKDSISQQQQLRITYEEKLKSYEGSESVNQLQETISWMDASSVKSVPIIEHLTALLPKRGYILSYNYSEEGSLQITIQFDTSRESAYYLKLLKNSTNFEEVKILSLLTNPYEDIIEQISVEESVPNEKYVPRYIAVYDLTLNVPTLLEQQKEGEQ